MFSLITVFVLNAKTPEENNKNGSFFSSKIVCLSQ